MCSKSCMTLQTLLYSHVLCFCTYPFQIIFKTDYFYTAFLYFCSEPCVYYAQYVQTNAVCICVEYRRIYCQNDFLFLLWQVNQTQYQYINIIIKHNCLMKPWEDNVVCFIKCPHSLCLLYLMQCHGKSLSSQPKLASQRWHAIQLPNHMAGVCGGSWFLESSFASACYRTTVTWNRILC